MVEENENNMFVVSLNIWLLCSNRYHHCNAFGAAAAAIARLVKEIGGLSIEH